MTDKKKTTVKKASTKKAGAPCKYKALLVKKTWEQIEQLVSRGMSRDFIAKFFDVNKDTLLKAIKEKGWESFDELKKFHDEDFFGQIKAKFKTRVLDEKDMSDKLLIYAMENYVLPKEQVKEEDSGNTKVVFVPIQDFGSPEKLQEAVLNQQSDLKDRMAERKRQLEEENNASK